MNRALDDTSTTNRVASSTLFALKAFAMGAISGTNGPEGARPSSAYWTLVQCCDSVTVKTDGTDLLGGGTYDSTKWVRAAAGVAHTWFVIKGPTGQMDQPWYLIVDWGSANDQTATFNLTRTLPSGGTTTAGPTSGAMTSRVQIFAEASANAAKAHYITDANGNFFFLESRNGQGIFQFLAAVQELTEARASGDAARAVLLLSQATNARGAWDFVTVTTGFGNYMLTMTGTSPAANITKVMLPCLYNNSGSAATWNQTGTNAIDSKVDRLPVYIFDATVAGAGIRGRLADVFSGSAQVATGSVEPSTGTPEEVMVGNMWLPCSVAPSL